MSPAGNTVRAAVGLAIAAVLAVPAAAVVVCRMLRRYDDLADPW